MTATVTRTKHHTAVAADLVTQGKFYFKHPGQMCLTFDEGKEMLLMDGNSFLLVNDGKSSVAKGKEASHLALLQRVLQSLLSGGDGVIEAQDAGDMEVVRQDNILCITPTDKGAKGARRMMFTSFTLTVDPGTSGLKSLRMNEKGGNYTQYDFSGNVLNEVVDDDVFNPGI